MSMRSVIFSVVALAIIIAGLLYFKPSSFNFSNPGVKEYSYTLQDKNLTSGPSTISVTEGDKVQINVTADKDWPELHLHGYELHQTVKSNIPTSISFTADKTGNFPIEVHFNATDDADALTLATLQVYPK